MKRSSRPKKSPCSKHSGLHEPKSTSPRLGYRYWTMSVSNIAEITDAVAAAGYKVRIPVTEIRANTSISMVEDPDGNWVEFLAIG